MDCTIYVAKTKALIKFAVTAKLICVFVFAYAKSRFSHDEAHITITLVVPHLHHQRDITLPPLTHTDTASISSEVQAS